MGSSGAMAEVNPLRYRGYYFDQEIGLYYLKSRYYDPFVCRFVNADTTISTGQEFLGFNMFAYCNNNPVASGDSQGEFANWLVGGVIGGLVGGIVSSVKGDGFGAGFAQGFTSGAIAGAAVDIALAVVATGPVGLIAAPAIAWVGGAIGSLAGDQAYSIAKGEGLRDVTWYDIGTAAWAGVLNVGAFAMAGIFKYADEGIGGFNRSPKLEDIADAAFSESFTPVVSDVYSTFTAINFTIYGYALSSARGKRLERY